MVKNGWKIATTADYDAAYAFFDSVKDATNPPFSTYPGGIRGNLESVLTHGTLLAAEAETEGVREIVGLLGYFHGVPRFESGKLAGFTEPEVGYVYYFVIAPAHRHPLSYRLVPFLARCMLADGHEEARFRTYRDNNDMINKLYRKHGTFLREETNVQGVSANLYMANVREWAERFGFYENTGS